MSGLYGHLVHTKSSFTYKDFYAVCCLFVIQASILFVFAVFDLKKQDDVMKMISDAKELVIDSVHKLSDHLKNSNNDVKVDGNGVVIEGNKGGVDENQENTPATSASSSMSSVELLTTTSSTELTSLRSQVTSLKSDNQALQTKIKALEEAAASASKTETNDDEAPDASPTAPQTEKYDGWFFSSSPTKATEDDEDKKKIEELEKKLNAAEMEMARLESELSKSSKALEENEKKSKLALEEATHNQEDAKSEMLQTNKELTFKNDQLTAQLSQLQSKLNKIENEITGERATSNVNTPDKIYRLIEVYKDEIHEMHDTYAQQSYELFSVKDELSSLKKQLETKDSGLKTENKTLKKKTSKENIKVVNKGEESDSKAGWFGWNTPPVTPERPVDTAEEKDPTITTKKTQTSGSNSTTTTVITTTTEEESKTSAPSSPSLKPSGTPGRFRELALASEPVKAVEKAESDPKAIEKIRELSKSVKVVETAALTKASMLLQRVVRGRRGRNAYKKKLEEIPHVIVVGVEKAQDLLLNDDVFSSLPDTYILVNVIKKKENAKKSYVFSSKNTAISYQSTSPMFNEDLKITSCGSGTLVLSVMSAHTMISDTFLGQVSINLDDYRNLGNGERHHFTLPLSEIKYPMYDKTGTIKTIENRTSLKGEISFTIDTPSISENIAGWWFEIANDVFGALNSQKIWVILRGDEMICYESNFENGIVGILKLKDIASVEETEYTRTEIAMKGVKIHFKDSNVPSRTWCFGEDNLDTRGMWIHALKKHCPSA